MNKFIEPLIYILYKVIVVEKLISNLATKGGWGVSCRNL